MGLTIEADLCGEGVVDPGDGVSRELNVNNRANDTCNAARGTGGRGIAP